MADKFREVGGIIERLVDAGASTLSDENGGFRESYAPVVSLLGTGGGTPTFTGTLTNNGAAPAASTLLGVMPAIANVAPPSWTEGRLVLLSTDLSGRLRTVGSSTVADATATPTTALQSQGFPQVYNGTTWDMVRAANSAAATTGTGLPGAGMMFFDGTNWQKWTSSVPTGSRAPAMSVQLVGNGAADGVSNTFNMTCDPVGSVATYRVTPLIFNGTTWDRPYSANAATGTTGTGLPGAVPMLWDGTNYQRQKDVAAAVSGQTTGLPATALYGWGSSTWSRLQTQNATADGHAGTASLTISGQLFNGATWDRPRTPITFKVVALGAGTAETTIWTPTSGKKFRLMGFVLTCGAASTLTFKDNTSGTTIFAARGTTDQPISPSGMGNGILSAAANNVFTVTRGTSCTLDGVVWGTEE